MIKSNSYFRTNRGAALQTNQPIDKRTIARITHRLIPFLFLLYIVAYMDRVNVGFAQLQMKSDLGFSDEVYGLGAGIFFIGYCIFSVPSNMVLQKIGARHWIAPFMVVWGIIAAGMMFIQSTTSFYVMRFLLGVGEAGFFPGMIFFLSEWFPEREKARAVSLFMIASPISGIIGGPIAGALLGMHGFGGLEGWKWLFLIEGIPPIILAVFVWFFLTEQPSKAGWLKKDEKEWLITKLDEEKRALTTENSPHNLSTTMKNYRIWMLSLIYFSVNLGSYGVSLWLPQIVQNLSGYTPFLVGVVTVIPFLCAVIGMLSSSAHSDKTGERYLHTAIPGFIGATGLVIAALSGSPIVSLAAICFAALGIWGIFGPFWTLPTSYLTGSAAASGIALINSIGNLGGFGGPYLIGFLKQSSGSYTPGLLVLAVAVLTSGLLTLIFKRLQSRNREG